MNQNDTTIQSSQQKASLSSGTTVLLTGAAKRLGAAMARSLAAAGCDIIVHYNSSASEAAALASEISTTGRQCYTIRADLADSKAVEELIDRANELLPPGQSVNLLVNNASIFIGGGLLKTDSDQIQHNIAIHAAAPLILSRNMASALAARCPGRPASIINMLDARMHDVDPDHAAYHLSKRMLLDITRLLALELAPAIRVNAIAPGLILPPEGQDSDYLERLRHSNPLKSCGTVDEVAQAAVYLASSNFVTGQVIYIDGGRHIKGSVHH